MHDIPQRTQENKTPINGAPYSDSISREPSWSLGWMVDIAGVFASEEWFGLIPEADKGVRKQSQRIHMVG